MNPSLKEMLAHLPDPLPVPTSGPVDWPAVTIPGSKSLTNRALPLAAVAKGSSLITGALFSEDTEVMTDSLRKLGINVTAEPDQRDPLVGGGQFRVDGCGGRIPVSRAQLFLGNSGTSIRFLAALLATATGDYLLDGIERMRQRPIGDLTRALNSLGVDASCQMDNNCPPVRIQTAGLTGGSIDVPGNVSSQFLSALLMAAPMASGPLTIAVSGTLVSKPYVDMTLATMKRFGIEPESVDPYRSFQFAGNQIYRGIEYAVEPDASSASYFFAAAAITGGKVTVNGLTSSSLQGDFGLVDILRQMGCEVTESENATTVVGGPLKGVNVDMNAISDMVPTLAAVACFADSPTTITNVAHIRDKECDRISAVAAELTKLGVKVDEKPDSLTIHPDVSKMQGTAVDTYNDHRMAMSLATIGLKIPGVEIRNPRCSEKTFPNFFPLLKRLLGE